MRRREFSSQSPLGEGNGLRFLGFNQLMNIASYLFGFILATLLGAVFHLWKDGGIGRLVFYLLLSWLGFLIGHWAAKSLGLGLMNIGPVNLAGGVVGSIIFLFLGNWIGKVEPDLVAKVK
jgi:hypothetical protein